MSNTCGGIGAIRPSDVLDVPLTATMRPRSIAVSLGGAARGGRSCALCRRLKAEIQRVEAGDGKGAHAVGARVEGVDVTSAAPLPKRTP